jgi:hypothetical protein
MKGVFEIAVAFYAIDADALGHQEGLMRAIVNGLVLAVRRVV